MSEKESPIAERSENTQWKPGRGKQQQKWLLQHKRQEQKAKGTLQKRAYGGRVIDCRVEIETSSRVNRIAGKESFGLQRPKCWGGRLRARLHSCTAARLHICPAVRQTGRLAVVFRPADAGPEADSAENGGRVVWSSERVCLTGCCLLS